MDIARIDLAIADDADALELVVGGRDAICRGLLGRSTQANTKEEGNDKEARSLWDVLLHKALDLGRCLSCVRPHEGRVCTANLEKE